jgi:hypothetical protein
MALPLIDKLDSFEIVRDQIAAILATESAAQQVLATAASKDPLLWVLNVYKERDWPLEQWLNAGPTLTAATAPVVTVWMEQSSFDAKSSSNTAAQQMYDVTYNIDITARGVSANDVAGGYDPADREARMNCQAAVRLVRNILSATENRYLGLRTIVWGFPQFETFEMGPAPSEEHQSSLSAWSCRARFKVKMTEMSPEFTDYANLELIHIDTSDAGQVILESEFS